MLSFVFFVCEHLMVFEIVESYAIKVWLGIGFKAVNKMLKLVCKIMENLINCWSSMN